MRIFKSAAWHSGEVRSESFYAKRSIIEIHCGYDRPFIMLPYVFYSVRFVSSGTPLRPDFIRSLSLGRVSHSRGRNILPITYNDIHSFRSTIISKPKSKDGLRLCCHFKYRVHNPCCFRYCSLKLSSGLRVCGEF